LLVNYYPESKKRSAYVDGTTGRRTGITPEQAIEMCFTPPPIVCSGAKDKRKGKYRNEKRRMLRKSNKCHWCGKKLSIATATTDHVIPLHRGGLDNANNRVLACEPCNTKRGHAMPELKEEANSGIRQD
jgi:transcription elongation factor Elf1